MTVKRLVSRALVLVGLSWVVAMYRRRGTAKAYLDPRYALMRRWLWTSNEIANFTYPLTRANQAYLAQCLSVVTGRPVPEIDGFFAEIAGNEELKRAVIGTTRGLSAPGAADARC